MYGVGGCLLLAWHEIRAVAFLCWNGVGESEREKIVDGENGYNHEASK